MTQLPKLLLRSRDQQMQMYDLLCYLQVCLASCGLSNSHFLAYAAYVTKAKATDNTQQLCTLLKNLQVSLDMQLAECSTLSELNLVVMQSTQFFVCSNQH